MFNRKGSEPIRRGDENFTERKNTSAIADVMTLGMGSVVSPMPKLMTLASGYFFR
jgi:hypothetical protein